MDHDLLSTQRTLRRRFFEGPHAIRWRPARELAAQLLLYLDDSQACWQLTTDWVRDILDADRVDAGTGGYVRADGVPCHYVVLAEAQREPACLPEVAGRAFDASDAGMRAVWSAEGLAVTENVTQSRRLSAGMRKTLQGLDVGAKIAFPLRDGPHPVGVLCADWQRPGPRWDPTRCEQLAKLAHHVVGQTLAVSARLTVSSSVGCVAMPAAACDATCVDAAPAWRRLTLAERRVARLVADGLSYKEVARQLDRSLSTVDHQLRAIREKLGVRSTARLVHLLNGCRSLHTG